MGVVPLVAIFVSPFFVMGATPLTNLVYHRGGRMSRKKFVGRDVLDTPYCNIKPYVTWHQDTVPYIKIGGGAMHFRRYSLSKKHTKNEIISTYN